MDFKESLDRVLKVLHTGGIILYPTDTVWGLGCDATNEQAVKRLMDIKRRPNGKGLVVLVDLPQRIPSYVDAVPDMAWELIDLADKPLTIVFDKGKKLSSLVYGKDGSVAIRVSQSKFCQQLISKFRKPIVSTSANFCGKPYPKSFNDIPNDLIDKVDLVVPIELDTDSTGKPSSIISVGKGNTVKILRD
jgi:L-threonylcarbamoyladenylate synthase